jgi:hypothetical protein
MQKYVHGKKLNDQLQKQNMIQKATFDESDWEFIFYEI